MHWDTLTYDEKWDLAFDSVDSDCDYCDDDLVFTMRQGWDIKYRSPTIKDAYARDPIMALEHVFEDRSSVPEVLDVLIYPSVKVRSVYISKYGMA